MSARTARWMSWTLCATSVVLTGVGLALYARNRVVPGTGPSFYAVDAAVAIGFPLIGAVIASRRPANPIGWLFCATALLGVTFFTDQHAAYTLVTDPGALPGGRWMAWIGTWLWVPGFLAVPPLLIMLFPDGHPPSPRWRPVIWAVFAFITALMGFAALEPGPNPNHPSVTNPVGVSFFPDAVETNLQFTVGLPYLAVMVAAVASLVVRFRRSKGEERAQLKWFVFAALLIVLWLLVPNSVVGSPVAAEVVQIITVLGLPVATAVAVLKYRLYEIDRLINRTLVYGLLTALLATVYAGLVLSLGQVFGGIGAEPPSWVVAGATLAVAALFQPARRRIQAAVDRRFNRRNYDLAQTVEAFSARLRDEVDLDTLSAELLAVVDQTVQPTRASLWLRPPITLSNQPASRDHPWRMPG
jgi:hypothetical protein